MQLMRIIRILVDYGVKYRTSLNDNNIDYNKNEISTLKTSSSTDCLKKAYTMLYNIDKRINDLQDLKLQIFSELFKKKSEPTDINIKMEEVDNSNNEVARLQNRDEQQNFHPLAAKILAETVKRRFARKTHSSSNYTMAAHLENSNTENFEDKSNKKKKVVSTSTIDVHENIENKCLNHSVTIQNLKSPVICLKVSF